MSPTSPHWYALRVRSRSEKVAVADLAVRGITVCGAVAPQRRVWGDRIRTLDLPLFPGYIFARFCSGQRMAVLRASGVAGIVAAGGVDLPVNDGEMEAVLTLVRTRAEVSHSPYIREGELVRVRFGPLSGLMGILMQIKSEWRVVVSVEFLHRAVSVEVDAALVEPVRQPGGMVISHVA